MDEVVVFRSCISDEELSEECFVECFISGVGAFDETKGFDVERMIETIVKIDDKSKARAIAEKCAVKREGTESFCEWAARGNACVKSESSKARGN